MISARGFWFWLLHKLGWRDRCEDCYGTKGGVIGNENVIGGRLVCDYCHAMRVSSERK